jgi:putative intracellular protease/amidase
MSRNILFIVTSNAHMGISGKDTGVWAEELAVPYYAFIDAGATVTIASPNGGKAPIDANSVKQKGENSAEVDRFLVDEAAQRAIRETLVASNVDASNFDAVFFPGGHGTTWDLPNDAGVTRAVETAFANDRIIAAVCHGPAGLVRAKRADGKSILDGKRVNAFTNAEEKAAGLMDIVPFALESKMRELGAKFESAALWQPYAVRDGKLITGQNPASSELVAKHVLDALNLSEKIAANSSRSTITR